MRVIFSGLLVLVVASFVIAEDPPSPAAKQFQTLLDEYEQQGGATTVAKQLLPLAAENPKDPVAVDALLWIVKHVRGRSETSQAIELLITNHLDSHKLGPACKEVAISRSLVAEKLLRTLLNRSPHAEVKAHACYALATLLDTEANVIDQLRAEPALAPRVLQYYGKEYGQHLASLESDKLAKLREQVYETMLNSFADVALQDTTLGEISKKALFAIRHLSVGVVAPDIEGKDIAGKEFTLSSFRGKVVMVTFWGHW